MEPKIIYGKFTGKVRTYLNAKVLKSFYVNHLQELSAIYIVFCEAAFVVSPLGKIQVIRL